MIPETAWHFGSQVHMNEAQAGSAQAPARITRATLNETSACAIAKIGETHWP